MAAQQQFAAFLGQKEDTTVCDSHNSHNTIFINQYKRASLLYCQILRLPVVGSWLTITSIELSEAGATYSLYVYLNTCIQSFVICILAGHRTCIVSLLHTLEHYSSICNKLVSWFTSIIYHICTLPYMYVKYCSVFLSGCKLV